MSKLKPKREGHQDFVWAVEWRYIAPGNRWWAIGRTFDRRSDAFDHIAKSKKDPDWQGYEFRTRKWFHQYALPKIELAAVRRFVDEVNRRAEANMLKTGKLEGSHYAAMRTVLAEMEANAK